MKTVINNLHECIKMLKLIEVKKQRITNLKIKLKIERQKSYTQRFLHASENWYINEIRSDKQKILSLINCYKKTLSKCKKISLK